MAVKVLRVEGMRDDTRTDDERARAGGGGGAAARHDVDAVLDAARRESGFDDFGARDFVERLGLLLGEVAADDNVWNAHKSMFVDHCTKAAVNRLLIQHYWSEHPEARDVTDRAADRRDRVATVGEHPPREPGGRRPPAPPPPGLRGRATGADPGGRSPDPTGSIHAGSGPTPDGR